MYYDRFQRLRAATAQNRLALHGTSYGNATVIRAEGLNPLKSDYVCTIPRLLSRTESNGQWARKFEKIKSMPEAEVLERLLGAILFAQSYAFRKYEPDSDLLPSDRDRPTLLVFRIQQSIRAEVDFDALNDDADRDTSLRRQAGIIGYRSFGKHNIGFGPHHLAAIAVLTRQDIEQTRRQENAYRAKKYGHEVHFSNVSSRGRFTYNRFAVKAMRAMLYAAESKPGDPVKEF